MKGALRIGKWRGTPVYVHWTTPLGFLVFFQFQFRPVAWLVFAGLILMHEWGHAVLVRRAELYVQSIRLQGNGGECAFVGYPAPHDRAIIAWGGVLGQVPALVFGLVLSALLGPTAQPLLIEAAATLVEINVFLMCLNLLPIPGLDGYHAWRLFAPANLSALFRRSRSRWLRERARRLERKLNEMRWKRGMN